MVKKVLFVCLSNARRSQMAEAIFNRMGRGRAASAGVEPAEKVDENVITVLEEAGIEAERLYPKKVTERMLEEADRIITFQCIDKIPAKHRGKVEDWNIGAESSRRLQEVYSFDYLRMIRDQIYEGVRELVGEGVGETGSLGGEERARGLHRGECCRDKLEEGERGGGCEG